MAPESGNGLYFMDSSSAAAECVTLTAAGGAVIHTFPTGQGNVIGNPIVPVIKITANPRTVRTMAEHVDVYVSGILRREQTIAFAAPRSKELPLVVDLSLSKTARGKVMSAAKAGKPIPEGWALDADGRPTTDPQAALKGTMLPAGDAKGAMLALVVEVLCATLTGANHSYEATLFFDAEGAPPGVGQTLIAFDPRCTGNGAFASRIESLLSEMTAQDGVRLPGSRRSELRASAQRDGVAIPSHLHAEITALLEA